MVAGFSIVLIIITFAILFGILALVIAGQCKIFTKAGQPGWAAIIPIYNIYVMLKIIKMEWWHLLIIIGFEIISGLDISVAKYIGTIGILVYEFIMAIKLAKCFGKGAGFGVLSVFFPFVCYPVLGFGSATYQEK